MPFKKGDPKTSAAAIKGNKGVRRGPWNETWQQKNPERYDSIIQLRKKLGRATIAKCMKNDPQFHSKAGKLSRVYENIAAEDLKKRFDKIFLPYVVCDRICVSEKGIVFVEIKRTRTSKSHLTPKQREFKTICEHFGMPYEVVYV